MEFRRGMEANLCDIGNLDADVLLPPRKRLLAGFKQQNSDDNTLATPNSPSSSQYQSRLNNMLASHFYKNHNLSPEQIVQASKSAADAALRAAEAAKASAERKAILAAQAVTAAKTALALVASFPEQRNLKKNKLRKHVQLQLLYKKHQPVKNLREDKELARNLHRDINSSPRISRKGHKNKKLRISPTSERTPNRK